MATTKFNNFIEYFNSSESSPVTRKDMLKDLEEGKKGETKTDHYRKAAELVGYIERLSRGVYRLVIRIPSSTTWYELRQRAYPNTYGKR